MDNEDPETTHYLLECEGSVGEWHWTAKNTKLLVDLYSERIHRFRDPKVRKRSLWTEIVDDMERAGYKGINEDLCDQKWRNMRKTYRTCRQTLIKNGRKRVAWEYYNTFDDMFQNENASASVNTEIDTVIEEQKPSFLSGVYTSLDGHKSSSDTNNADISVTQEQQRQLLVLERSRISAIRELSKRIEESNAIQRERNDLLREYLSQL